MLVLQNTANKHVRSKWNNCMVVTIIRLERRALAHWRPTLNMHMSSIFRARVTSYNTRGRPFPQLSIGVATSNSVSGPLVTTLIRKGCSTSVFMRLQTALCSDVSVIFLPSLPTMKILISVFPLSSVAIRPSATYTDVFHWLRRLEARTLEGYRHQNRGLL